ncbi:MAG: glycosyltransferase family 4 protein [Micrococcus sp.]|nr:glycosyltransferase family 4 protein [Micrococcus sp.]
MSRTTKKVAWIVNHYAPFEDKDGWAGLHVEIARELAESEWDVHVVAAGTSHPAGQSAMPTGVVSTPVRWRGSSSTWVKAPAYTGNGLARIANMGVFGLRLLDPRVRRSLPRPDVIVGRVVNPAAALTSWMTARYYKVPYVLEISDIWPDTLVQLGKMSRGSLPARTLGLLESSLIRGADAVMSPLPRVDTYLKDKGFSSTPFYWVHNGIAAEQPELQPASRPAESDFHWMYFGSLGHANAVDTILAAFSVVAAEPARGQRVTLEIVGSGPLRDELVELAARLNVAQRVTFTDRLPRSEILDYAQRADALIANMRDLQLYSYGIALNKVFDYLLAARPILFATNAANNVVADADAGVAVPADDAAALSRGMVDMMETPQGRREQWGRQGRDFVLSHYTYRQSAQQFERMLHDVTSSTPSS